MSNSKGIFLFFLSSFLLVQIVGADTLRVGIKEAPPFTIKTEDGWEGLTMILWHRIEEELGVVSELVPMDMDEMTKALATGDIDVGLGAITVNRERESSFDFSSVYYLSGLGMMTKGETSGLWILLKNTVSKTFLKVVLSLCMLLLLVGFLIWLVEKRKNPEEFQPGWKGVFSGFWWSAVTMTTVGYGDKAPRSGFGRLIGLVWMFASLIMISYFTASMASALTVYNIGLQVEKVEDLRNVKTGVIQGTVAQEFLSVHGIPHIVEANLGELVKKLENGEVRVVVADDPLLGYYLNRNQESDLVMLPHKIKNFFMRLH